LNSVACLDFFIPWFRVSCTMSLLWRVSDFFHFFIFGFFLFLTCNAYTGGHGVLEHLKIERRLINEKFESVMGYPNGPH
jgi:hypothetical protein